MKHPTRHTSTAWLQKATLTKDRRVYRAGLGGSEYRQDDMSTSTAGMRPTCQPRYLSATIGPVDCAAENVGDTMHFPREGRWRRNGRHAKRFSSSSCGLSREGDGTRTRRLPVTERCPIIDFEGSGYWEKPPFVSNTCTLKLKKAMFLLEGWRIFFFGC
jgi:hypothetical protein